ncbi:hypothetical protein LCGC14_2663190, partial [marine sediment metagenome]
LSPYDVENIGEFTRENVEGWLHKNAGDFQSIEDFFATVGDKEIPWAKEENEFAYSDAVYGNEVEASCPSSKAQWGVCERYETQPSRGHRQFGQWVWERPC